MSRQAAINEYNKMKEKGLIVLGSYGITIPAECHKIQGSPSFQLALKCIDETRKLKEGSGAMKMMGEILYKKAKKKAMRKVIEYKTDCENFILRLQSKDKVCCMCGHQYDDDEWNDGDDDCVKTCSEGCLSQIPEEWKEETIVRPPKEETIVRPPEDGSYYRQKYQGVEYATLTTEGDDLIYLFDMDKKSIGAYDPATKIIDTNVRVVFEEDE